MENRIEVDDSEIGFHHAFGAIKRMDVLCNVVHMMLGGASRHNIDEEYHRAFSHIISNIKREVQHANLMLERAIEIHAPSQVMPRTKPTMSTN